MRGLTLQPNQLFLSFPADELLPGISKFCMNDWPDIWDCYRGNKLHSLYPNVGTVTRCKALIRYDSVLINRL